MFRYSRNAFLIFLGDARYDTIIILYLPTRYISFQILVISLTQNFYVNVKTFNVMMLLISSKQCARYI